MRDHLTQVVESAMQLKSIIDEMVSLRRIDTGNAQVSLTDVSVVASVETVLRELRPLAERKSLRISTDFSDDLPTVFADEQVFYLILTNLLSNAIKFTSAEGAIHISAYRDGENVVVAVSDTGIGIPQEDLSAYSSAFTRWRSRCGENMEALAGVGYRPGNGRSHRWQSVGREPVESRFDLLYLAALHP